jgi:hypothetical protein
MASDPVRLAVVVRCNPWIDCPHYEIPDSPVHRIDSCVLVSWNCLRPSIEEVIKHFEKGFGDVLSLVGIVIGLGAMLGGILISSGGADVLANDLINLGVTGGTLR